MNKYVHVSRFMAQRILESNLKNGGDTAMQYQSFPDDGIPDEERNSAAKKIIGDRLEVLQAYKHSNGAAKSHYGPHSYAEVPPLAMNEFVQQIPCMNELSIYKQAQGNWGVKMLTQQRITSKMRSYRQARKKTGQQQEQEDGDENPSHVHAYRGGEVHLSLSSANNASHTGSRSHARDVPGREVFFQSLARDHAELRAK